MPVVEIKMLAGRDAERKNRLIADVTSVVSETLEVAPEKVVVLLHEMAHEHYATGGAPKSATRAR
jgi:4-oxalocrotonate tautomerase